MKQLTALLLSFAGTVGVSSGTTVSFSLGRAADPKEPPSTTLVVHVESSSNSTTTTTAGGGAVSAASVSVEKASELTDYSPLPLVKYEKPLAPMAFWNKLAKCETNGDWKNRGQYAGGLGIYTVGKFGAKKMGTWEHFGGEEFAPSPDKATKAEQIIIANRISVLGYTKTVTRDAEWAKIHGVPVVYQYVKRPVGFNGWGCTDNVGGRPGLVAHSPETVISQKFKWGQRGRLVKDLQAIVGVPQDGKYGARTWAAHARYVMLHNVPRVVLPSPRIARPKSTPSSLLKRCPKYEKIAYDVGFPSKEIQNVSYVMWREARCKAKVVNNAEGAYGLMQIDDVWFNRLRRLGVVDFKTDLLNPTTNLTAAFVIWTWEIERRGTGWQPWSLR